MFVRTCFLRRTPRVRRFRRRRKKEEKEKEKEKKKGGKKEEKKKNKNARKYGRSIQYFTERLRNNRSRIRERLDTRRVI